MPGRGRGPLAYANKCMGSNSMALAVRQAAAPVDAAPPSAWAGSGRTFTASA